MKLTIALLLLTSTNVYAGWFSGSENIDSQNKKYSERTQHIIDRCVEIKQNQMKKIMADSKDVTVEAFASNVYVYSPSVIRFSLDIVTTYDSGELELSQTDSLCRYKPGTNMISIQVIRLTR